MNKKDVVWQNLLDKERLRLSALPDQELRSMDAFSSEVVHDGEVTIEYGIWHEVRSEDVEYSSPGEARSLPAQLDRSFGVPRPRREIHLFVLKASRRLVLGFHRTYLAGFSLDGEGKIIPVSDEVLSDYD